MAALPYMQLYIADYLADTMHLTTEEHGAYLLLLFNYWQTGKPIPKARLSRIARLGNDRWASVESSLNEFFTDNGTEWVHDRIERDLDSVHAAQSQRSAAGKASAEARKNKTPTKLERKSNARSTTAEVPLNESQTNRDTDTDTDTDKSNPLNPPAGEGAAAKPKPQRAKPKRVIPEPFLVSVALQEWSARRTPAVNIDLETERFINHFKAEGKTKADWDATWQNWMLRAQTDTERYVHRPSGNVNRQQQIEDANNAVVRDFERQEREGMGAPSDTPDFVGTGEPIIEGDFIRED